MKNNDLQRITRLSEIQWSSLGPCGLDAVSAYEVPCRGVESRAPRVLASAGERARAELSGDAGAKAIRTTADARAGRRRRVGSAHSDSSSRRVRRGWTGSCSVLAVGDSGLARDEERKEGNVGVGSLVSRWVGQFHSAAYSPRTLCPRRRLGGAPSRGENQSRLSAKESTTDAAASRRRLTLVRASESKRA